MKKQGISRINTTLIVLVTTFLVVVFGGRFLFNNTLPVDNRISKDTVATNRDATSSVVVAESAKTTQVESALPKAPTCAEALRADIEQKKQSFVKGQILVTFSKDLKYEKAKDVLSVYGIVVQNEIESQASFKTRKLITAAVAPGQEIVKVCQLRGDAQVKYAGLDLYFNLHD